MRTAPRRALRLLPLPLCLALLGCPPDITERAVPHDSPEARRLLAERRGQRVAFEEPRDRPPAIAREYRFAHGDLVRIELFGLPGTRRDAVRVDADGNVHYLAVHAVPAAGRTVPELRAELERRLAAYYQDPVVSLQPVATVGHRFFVFGQVAAPGAFPLERPLRVLDGLALAGGAAGGLRDGRTADLADLERSFLVRDGEFLPIDFDALIEEGDLRYNVHLHPGDLLYLASTLDERVYAIGALRAPGTEPFEPGLTVLGLLARRGGLLERSHRSQVVVIRGNINRPLVFTVDVQRILAGRTADFVLEPDDIVYVPVRPYHYLRELAFEAVRAFVSSFAANVASDATRDTTTPIIIQP